MLTEDDINIIIQIFKDLDASVIKPEVFAVMEGFTAALLKVEECDSREMRIAALEELQNLYHRLGVGAIENGQNADEILMQIGKECDEREKELQDQAEEEEDAPKC